MDEQKIVEIVKDLRKELGYDVPPPQPAPDPPEWLVNFFNGLNDAFYTFFQWVGHGGWRILVPVLVVLAGIIVWLLLRKVPGRQSVRSEEETGEMTPERATDLPADRWLAKAEAEAAAGDFTGAILSLYRAGLFVCLKRLKPEGELANREIRFRLPREWRDPFEKLYLAAERILFDDRTGTPGEYGILLDVYREGFR